MKEMASSRHYMGQGHNYQNDRTGGGGGKGKPIGGFDIPKTGSVIPDGATHSGTVGSDGEKGRATDPNCDKYHNTTHNP